MQYEELFLRMLELAIAIMPTFTAECMKMVKFVLIITLF